jgi:hypothetical protein
MITYQIEAWKDYWPDAVPLWEAHWREIAVDQDVIPLQVNMDDYTRLAETDALHIVTVRDAGRLVGYWVGVIRPHLHYANTVHAFTDVFWLAPAYRKGMTGVRLFRTVDATLQARGVRKVLTATKLHFDVSALFTRLGYQPVELVYSKILPQKDA